MLALTPKRQRSLWFSSSHSCESWAMKSGDKKRVDAFELLSKTARGIMGGEEKEQMGVGLDWVCFDVEKVFDGEKDELIGLQHVWNEPSVRRISTSVCVGVGMCSVVAMQADPWCAESAADMT